MQPQVKSSNNSYLLSARQSSIIGITSYIKKHSEILWSTYLLSDVYVCGISVCFYKFCRILTSLGKIFALCFYKTSPIDSHLNQTYLALKRKRRNLLRIALQERILFCSRSFAFWLTLALLVLASIPTTEGEFLVKAIFSPNCCQCNRTQGTSHRHLNKSSAHIRFPQKKRVRWTRKILPLHAILDQRTTEFIFTMQFYPNISCITWHLDGWKKKVSFVLPKFGSLRGGSSDLLKCGKNLAIR